MDPVRQRFFRDGDLQAATMVEVCRLDLRELFVKINAIASVNDGDG
jgi:hypothetical protein